MSSKTFGEIYPDWVLKEASRRTSYPEMSKAYQLRYHTAYRALCDTIMEFVTPPTDPYEVLVERLYREVFFYGDETIKRLKNNSFYPAIVRFFKENTTINENKE